jgi:hypothetical protein
MLGHRHDIIIHHFGALLVILQQRAASSGKFLGRGKHGGSVSETHSVENRV